MPHLHDDSRTSISRSKNIVQIMILEPIAMIRNFSFSLDWCKHLFNPSFQKSN